MQNPLLFTGSFMCYLEMEARIRLYFCPANVGDDMRIAKTVTSEASKEPLEASSAYFK